VKEVEKADGWVIMGGKNFKFINPWTLLLN